MKTIFDKIMNKFFRKNELNSLKDFDVSERLEVVKGDKLTIFFDPFSFEYEDNINCSKTISIEELGMNIRNAGMNMIPRFHAYVVCRDKNNNERWRKNLNVVL